MPQLIIEQPGVPPLNVELTKMVTAFGRADDNDIVLVADEVSRYHARIKVQVENSLLLDLKSLNGTYVNRQRIVERVLADKDEVWFGGKCRAIFHDDADGERKARFDDLVDSSSLSKGLDQIREEMDLLSQSMTMIGGEAEAVPTMQGGVAPPDAPELQKMRHAFRRLDALYKASTLMASEFDIDTRMSEMLDLAMEVMNARRGFLMTVEEGTDKLEVRVAREMGQELGSSSPSQGIARRAAIDGHPVLMADSAEDEQFGMRESIIRQKIRSAMCVPLKIEDRILGSLYVDSSQLGIAFTEEDLELFQALANQSALAIENVRLYERMLEAEKKRANLGRFLSPAIVDVIMNQEDELELGGQTSLVTTMFCDIRGFTNMSERLEPHDLVELLNEHFTAMTKIVFQHNGTLDKYNGDEVMALFGAPITTEDDALQAVRAGLAMQAKNAELNEIRKSKGLPTFEVGIGINSGDVVAGYIGSPDRMDFTVLGDHVNVASRLCSIAKGGQVIVGESVYDVVCDKIEGRSIGTPVLKGKDTAVTAYEMLGNKVEEDHSSAKE